MSPTTQLIQLTLRIEREAEKQRRSSTAYRDDLATEKSRSLSRREDRVNGSSHLFCPRQQCECA